MYLRHTIRKKDGKVHRYWTLVRSVRVGRRVIQQSVAHLGELDEHAHGLKHAHWRVGWSASLRKRRCSTTRANICRRLFD